MKVSCPLYNQISEDSATQKKKKVIWVEECQEAFDMLKAPCISAPILAFTDFTKPFKLHMDASTTGLDAILYQEQDGNNWVLGYDSKALSKSESCYPAPKLKFLALKWAVTESFQECLYGNTSSVYSDNNPLTSVLTTARLDATGHW